MNWYNKYILNGFFGWENFKWLVREWLKTYSNQHSFFSRKRIESCILFVGGFSLLYGYALKRLSEGADYAEALALTGAMFVYAGYTAQLIKREAKTEDLNKHKSDEPTTEPK
jgi:hypothetical protein